MKNVDVSTKLVYRNKLYSQYNKKIIKYKGELYQRLGRQVRFGEKRYFSEDVIEYIKTSHPTLLSEKDEADELN